jgi:hypothetical protein
MKQHSTKLIHLPQFYRRMLPAFSIFCVWFSSVDVTSRFPATIIPKKVGTVSLFRFGDYLHSNFEQFVF